MLAQLSLIVVFAVGASADPTVQTSFGKLIGNARSQPTCHEFLGVPFAQPPIKHLRFAAPVPWSEPYPTDGRSAKTPGSVCLQSLGGSEDCLFLNVWKPTVVVEKLPVMVWIPGGGWVGGAGSFYDGCQLTTHSVVVASMNYRLGPFGFLAFEDGELGSNFGLKDQRQALGYLRDEVAGFGGDSAKVTIFGESAGATSVFHHVASPLSRGLFRAAISQSGYPNAYGWHYAKNNTRTIAAKVNCTGGDATLRACMRTVNGSTLLSTETGGTSQYNPVVDGEDMPEYPASLFMKHQINGVTLMAGTHTNEGNAWVWTSFPSGMTNDQYQSYVGDCVNGHDPVGRLNTSEMADVFARYPTAGFMSDNRPAASALITDSSFLCGTQMTGWEYTSADFFLYHFNHRSSSLGTKDVPGVYHGMEVPYVFGDDRDGTWTADEKALSLRMQAMWTNFAKYLDPSLAVGTFPKYENGSRLSLVIQAPSDVFENRYREDFCQFWRKTTFHKYETASGGPETVFNV